MTTKSNNIPIVASVAIYIIGFLIGLSTVLPIINIPIININNISKKVYCISFVCILINNLGVLAIQILGGLFLGIPTFLIELYNAVFFGYLIKYSINKFNINKILILTLPHCIFEIPAIIIAGAAGFKIPYEIVRYLAGKKEQPLTKEDVKEYLTLALISIILIVIAAWIEANITLKIARAMLKSKGI